jgi:antitoxin (DNA-binding transcriptional repressor) of toxin-antitoxin stability system
MYSYNLVMNIVNVAILKEKLSYYLNLVKSGQELVVTSHRHRVARILPVSAPSAEIVEPTRPVKDLRKVKGIKPKRSVSGVSSLLDDRRRR